MNKTSNSDPMYTLEDHCHLFAAWAAARAAQRQLRGGSNGTLINAIAASGLRAAIAQRESWPKTADQFDAKHREWCGRIIDHSPKLDLSYGRAAKLVAIYLKCRIVNAGHNDTDFGRVIHPPIDRILLQAIHKEFRHDPKAAGFDTQTWTRFDANEYFAVIEALRLLGLDKPAFWMAERYWKPDAA